MNNIFFFIKEKSRNENVAKLRDFLVSDEYFIISFILSLWIKVFVLSSRFMKDVSEDVILDYFAVSTWIEKLGGHSKIT